MIQSLIHTPTPDLKESVSFYKKLNFQVLSGENPSLLTDGKALIEIEPNRFARAGVKLFRENWSKLVKEIEQDTTVTTFENGYLVGDPNGVWVYLIEATPEIDYQRKETCFGLTGNFAGMSIETTDMTRSAGFWEALGFSKKAGDVEQGWVTYVYEDGLELSLMGPLGCPHLFFNPSLNYFNGKDNLKVIDNVRKTGIPITEEITYFNKKGIVDNVIIRDPGGYGFFLFSD